MSGQEALSRLENSAAWVKHDAYKVGGYEWMMNRLEKMREGIQSKDTDVMEKIGEELLTSFMKDPSIKKEPMLGICAFTIVGIMRCLPALARQKDAETMKMISEINTEKLEKNLAIMASSQERNRVSTALMREELGREVRQSSYAEVERGLVDQIKLEKNELKPGDKAVTVENSEQRLTILRSMRLEVKDQAKRTTFAMRRTFADVWSQVAGETNPADVSLRSAIEALLGDAEIGINEHLELQLTLLAERLDAYFPEKSYQIGTVFKLARTDNRCIITLSPSGEKPIVLSMKRENDRYTAE